MYQSSDKVVFGDVNLSEASVRTGPNGGALGPGQGGWPTVRYFNKETGYDGAPYEKKTSKAMCDELGDIEYMKAYIEDVSNPCSPSNPENCSEKEQKYIKKWSVKLDKVESQISRLEKMLQKQMTPKLLQWVEKRIKILKQFDLESGKTEL